MIVIFAILFFLFMPFVLGAEYPALGVSMAAVFLLPLFGRFRKGIYSGIFTRLAWGAFASYFIAAVLMWGSFTGAAPMVVIIMGLALLLAGTWWITEGADDFLAG